MAPSATGRRESSGERYVEKISSGNDVNVFACDGNVSWIYGTDVERRQVSSFATEERRTVLFATRRIIVICNVQTSSVFIV